MRLGGLLVLLALLVAPTAASTRRVLFLRGDPGASVVGDALRLTDADGRFLAQLDAGRLSVTFENVVLRYSLSLSAPAGSVLGPGSYEDAQRWPFNEPGHPGLSLDGNGQGCNTVGGRFVIHELAFGLHDTVERLSLDFEQHCDGQAPAVHGSVRIGVGSDTCDLAPEGGPCDDGDACTVGDACAAGSCLGAFVGEQRCAAAEGPCTRPSACDPVTGTCPTPSLLLDGAACEDGDACTTTSSCQAGKCIGGSPITCDDGDPCTADRCDPASGCTAVPFPGACWRITGTARATACALSRCRSQNTPFSGIYLIADDGTYLKPYGRCRTTDEVLTAERGVWHRDRRGRIVLKPTNYQEFVDSFRRCPDLDPVLVRLHQRGRHSYRQVLEVATDAPRSCRGQGLPADERHLCGTVRLGGTVTVRGISVGVRVVWRFTGTRSADDAL